MKAFEPVRKITVVDGILSQLKAKLKGNHYGAGSRLPSERDLARELGVSRPSLREALRTLELMGVVDTRHGQGTQVADSGSKVLKVPLEFLLMLDQPNLADLHETRELIDVFMAGRAAERRTPEDLDGMKKSLDELKVRLDRKEGFNEPDLRFHQALWTASHHQLLERIMNCLQEHIYVLMDSVKPTVHDHKSSFEIHRKIFDAIRRKNAAQARRTMAIHHQWMTDELLKAKLIR